MLPRIPFGEVLAKHFGIPVINKTGGALTKGTLVYISGWDATAKRFKITVATTATPIFATAVLTSAVAVDGASVARPSANVTGLNTSGKTVGDTVYLSTAGGLTYTAPATNVQAVGYVTKVDAADGAIEFDLSYAGAFIKSLTSTVVTETDTVGASTAAAGADSAGATALPAGTAKVYPTTGADDTKGVRLHAGDQVSGRHVMIGNGVFNKILKVYPPTGGTINGAGADAAFSSAIGGGVIVVCLDAGANTWLAW